MHQHAKTAFGPATGAGHLYYVRLKTDFGPLYKLGFTSMSSVHKRLAYKGNGDEHLIDEVLLFLFHKDSLEFEQRLHDHFAGHKAFGNFSSNQSLPLYKNGQSELYPTDILGLDDRYTDVQGRLAREKVQRTRPKPAASPHWLIIVIATLLRWIFIFLFQLLACAAWLLEALFRVPQAKRGGLFGRPFAKKATVVVHPPSTAHRRREREIDALIAWVQANKLSAKPAERNDSPLPPAPPVQCEPAPAMLRSLEQTLSLPEMDRDPAADADPACFTFPESELADMGADAFHDDANTPSAAAFTSLIWDGLFFDRADWVDQALAAGASANTEDDDELSVLSVAAHLNRTRSVELLAQYGATYPNGRSYYFRDHAVLGPDIIDMEEPVNSAIDHANMPMMQTLLLLPWSDHPYGSSAEVSDRGWQSALYKLESRNAAYLMEIIKLAVLKTSDATAWDTKLWCDMHASQSEAGIRALFTRIQNGGTDQPAMRALPYNGMYGIGFRFSHTTFVGAVDQASARLLLQKSFVLIDEPADVCFKRTRLTDTCVAEFIAVNQSDLEFSFFYTDVGLFFAETSAAMDHWMAARADADTMAEWLVALHDGDMETASTLMTNGVDLDIPLWQAPGATRYGNSTLVSLELP
jgi:hypothetical protein